MIIKEFLVTLVDYNLLLCYFVLLYFSQFIQTFPISHHSDIIYLSCNCSRICMQPDIDLVGTHCR